MCPSSHLQLRLDLTWLPAALPAVLKRYGRDIISAVGAEVDRIEGEIQSLNPAVRYVDLETDRGRSTVAGRAGVNALSSTDIDFDPGPVSELASVKRRPA